MSTPFDDVEVPVTKKPWGDPGLLFSCAICRREIWSSPWDRPHEKIAPLCHLCTMHWGNRIGLQYSGLTRGDRRTYQRLSALTNALNWECINGRQRTL